MTYRLVTCPESAHLELLDYEEHPLGLLVTGCSRFRPPDAVSCPRTCAARIDRKIELTTAPTREIEIALDDGEPDFTRLELVAAR